MYRIGQFEESPRVSGLAIRSDGTLFASHSGLVFAGKDNQFALVPGQDDPAIGLVGLYIRPSDQAVFALGARSDGGDAGYFKLVDGAWQLHAPTAPGTTTRVVAPFIVDGKDRVVAMHPQLQRFDPATGAWTQIPTPANLSILYEDGIAIGPDGRVMVALEGTGIVAIEDDATLTFLVDCKAAEPPDACKGNVGIATGPRLFRNGMDGDVYWVSGGTLYAPLMWRWNKGNPVRVAYPAENRFFTNYAVERDGDVVLVERECNGCPVAELRRYTDVTESEALIDILPDRNYYPFIGHDDRLVLWSPQGDTWLGLFHVR